VLDLADADRAFELLPAVDDPLVESAFLSVYGSHLAAASRYEDARGAAALLLATARRYRLDFAVPYAVYAAGVAEAGLRNYEEAERTLSEGVRAARESSHAHGEQNCLAAQIRALAQQGRYDRALALAHDHSLQPAARVPRQMQAELFGTHALVLAAAGKLDEAVRTVDSIRGLSQAIEGIVLSAAVDAIVAVKRHDSAAIDTVNRLTDIAFSTGALDLLVTAYRSSPELLAIMLHGTSVPQRLRALVRRIGDEDLAKAVGVSVPDEGDARTSLTAREREVYELLQQGLTNREIARLLFITEATAKVHVQHIFEKLGIRSRKIIAMQAVLERAIQATSAIDDTGVGADS
jgi:ATP/maltotriose-dependent transcriptional regulator MalT